MSVWLRCSQSSTHARSGLAGDGGAIVQPDQLVLGAGDAVQDFVQGPFAPADGAHTREQPHVR
jgi:hypothetical protein